MQLPLSPGHRFGLFSIMVAASGLAPFACSASPNNTTSTGSGGAGAGNPNGSGTGGEDPTFVGSGPSSGVGGSCPFHCSADLHSVIDCHDNVVKTCPPDLGCSTTGDCVAPCDAAKANASTIGCDFYSVVPHPETETRGSCFAALLANTWTSPISITAEYNGAQLDIGGMARIPSGNGANLTYSPLPGNQLPPGQIAILFLSNYPSGDIFWIPCPGGVNPGVQLDPAVMDTGVGKAFHITTSAPVVAYDIYPYGGASSFISSATMLVPTPAWGTNYIAADAYETDQGLVPYGGVPFIQLVAAEDGTNVTISPTSAIQGGPGVAPTGQGQPITYSINKGQVVQLAQPAELAGSPISSDKPISVWGGTGCMRIPVGSIACDSGHQQLLPVKTLGYEYVAVRHRDRIAGANESTPWTIIGAVDATQYTYDPVAPPGAPMAMNSGQMVRFFTPNAFVIKSQDNNHPFYVAGHMTSALEVPNNNNYEGDPEYVNVVAPEQFLPHYLFLTDPTYSNTHLVFVRKKSGDNTFKDVTLDCLGTVQGWQPVGNGGTYEFAWVDLVRDGQPQGGCDNGVHTADSATPFGLTVWGWAQTASYAYPAGMSVQPINTVFVPPTPK